MLWRSWGSVLAVAAVFSASVLGLEDCGDKDVISLVTDHDSLVLLLYNPDCEPCKQIESELDEVRGDIEWKDYGLKGEETDVVFRRLNVREHPGIDKMVQGAGVPSILLVKGPWINEYTGRIVASEFGPWVSKRVGSLWTKYLDNESEMEKFLDEHDVALILESTVEGRKMFEMAAGSEREFATYGWHEWTSTGKNTTARLIVKKYGMQDAKQSEFDLGSTKKVYELLTKHQLPLITPASPNNVREFLRDPKPLVWFVCNSEREYLRFKKLVKPLLEPGRFSKEFYWLGLIGENERTARDFAATTLQIPKDQEVAIVVSDVSETGRWVMEEIKKLSDLTVEGVESFIKSIEDQTLEKYYYSQEPIPSSKRYPLDTKGYRRVAARELEDLLLKEEKKDTILVIEDPNNCEEHPCKTVALWGEKFALKAKAAGVTCVRVLNMAGLPLNELDSTWKFPNPGDINAAFVIPANEGNTASEVADLQKTMLNLKSESDLNSGAAESLRCDVASVIELLEEEAKREEL